ncbi:DUF4232 domain-containing protein [Kribbella antibiotica]|uniref:DUF4232 domain-containing protein n=1 Tax=Kribbella antibiotica TaxID=190195 RepID=A0A4R4ZS69_9ACTN|nr:DUF4232 domain-containing protein [Kribbella antibiotica]TDD61908.1 DUF4232 domain-containing protein [Kribbella antibiotica]
MRSKLPAVVISALLLTACGTQPAPAGADREVPVDSSCDTPPAGETSVPESGVRITGVSRVAPYCAEFEVTNSGKEAADYTVTFGFHTSSGEAVVNPARTVRGVAPGRTVKDTVTADDSRGLQLRVKIIKVRTIPTAEAPSKGSACPRTGVRLYADADADAAMGVRVLGIHWENCGTRTVSLNGHPRLQVLDESHLPVNGVVITTDGKAQPLVLKRGERATATLTWRNTLEAGRPNVNSPYARVWAKGGAVPVMLTPEFDLGSTGKVAVSPWQKDQR